jgi:hypothetical protein
VGAAAATERRSGGHAGDDWLGVELGFVEVVLPARAPDELGLDQLLEVRAIEQVV